MPPRPDRDLMPSELARLDEIRRVGMERADELAQTFTAAFADDPFLQWMTEGASGEFAKTLWEFALRHPGPGVEVLADQTSTAAAIWEPPEGSSTSNGAARPADSGAGFRQVLTSFLGEDRTRTMMDFYREMAAMRPSEPHWYLSAIAVDPSAQNQGWGHRVIAPMLRRCDEVGLPIYLESSNPRNHPFYARHGFAKTGTHTAPDGPELTLMLRSPAPA